MREFDEILRGSFDAHAGEIDRAGGLGSGLAARTVRDVRRKRTWRAGATGAIATAAVVGVVATALAFTGDEPGPAVQPLVMTDRFSLGPCTAYIPANGALLPEGTYQGRSYVDAAAGFVVAVMPDGTVTRVQPGPNGDYPFDFGSGATALMPWGDQAAEMPPLVIDHMSGGSAGGDIWVGANPAGWDWTLEPALPAPEGVSVNSLYSTLAITVGVGGQGYAPGAIPTGAVAEVVAIYSDGHEVRHALVRDMPGPGESELDKDGLQAVALRVTLADGQVWEIRADYTPENVPHLPCQPTPPSQTQPTASAPATEGSTAGTP